MFAAHDAVSADHFAGAFRLMVNHHQMFAHRIEPVEVALAHRHVGQGLRPHLVVKHAVAQGLGGIDLGR